MNQSTIIFGYMAVAFLIFITQRGELPIYWGFLVASPKGTSSGPTATKTGALGNTSGQGSLTAIGQMNQQNEQQFTNAVTTFAKIGAMFA